MNVFIARILQFFQVLSAGATVQREYLAMVEKSDDLALHPQGVIKDALMGPGASLQPATTLYHVLHSNDAVALMQLTPKTGRSCMQMFAVL